MSFQFRECPPDAVISDRLPWVLWIAPSRTAESELSWYHGRMVYAEWGEFFFRESERSDSRFRRFYDRHSSGVNHFEWVVDRNCALLGRPRRVRDAGCQRQSWDVLQCGATSGYQRSKQFVVVLLRKSAELCD
jgi:hypothetical protein